jgi:hypothetical protein
MTQILRMDSELRPDFKHYLHLSMVDILNFIVIQCLFQEYFFHHFIIQHRREKLKDFGKLKAASPFLQKVRALHN